MSKRPNRKSDRTAAVDLDVPSGVADDIELVLRDFAEEAELDTSLVVDHSGFLIAGISSIADVDVDTIGELVAGASGATEGLTGALGEDGSVESIHLGDDRLLYLREVGERFILVGVSDANVPAGILRDQAKQIEEDLVALLSKVKAIPRSLTKRESRGTQPANAPVSSAPPASLRQPETNQPKPAPNTGPVPAKANGNNGHGKEQVPNELPLPKQTSTIPRPAPAPAAVAEANPGGGGNGNGDGQSRQSGLIPGAIAAEKKRPTPRPRPANSPEKEAVKDPIPASIFEFEDSDEEDLLENLPPPRQDSTQPLKKPRGQITEGVAIVENSPFEMDVEDEDEDSFEPVLPNTTPAHLSVPMARQREAEAKKNNGDEEAERKSGPRYTFELG